MAKGQADYCFKSLDLRADLGARRALGIADVTGMVAVNARLILVGERKG